MRSIRSKILSLALTCVLVSNITVMLTGIISVSNVIRKDSNQIIQQLAEKKALEVDAKLIMVEKSVMNMREYLIGRLMENPEFLRQEDEVEDAMGRLHRLLSLELKNMEGAKGVYFCTVPESGVVDEGLYLIRTGDDQFIDLSIVELAADDQNNETNKSLCKESFEIGEPVWLLPRQSKSEECRVIAYLMPIFHDNRMWGVVGMDLDASAVSEIVSEVGVYRDCFSILMDSEGNFVYHPDYPDGVTRAQFTKELDNISNSMYRGRINEKVISYRWHGAQRRIIFRGLRNGMSVGITVSVSEMRRPTVIYITYTVLIVALVCALVIAWSARMSRRLVKPLQDLTGVARKLAGGDLDVKIRCETHDEVEMLANSMQHTADELKKHVASVNEFARTDALTNVHNKAAYQETVESLSADIRDQKAQFSVIVLDVNSLKHMNDTYGHEAGDLWITGAATAAERAFGRSRVYRIGGDEFAVILDAGDRRHYDHMLAEFTQELERFNSRPDKIYTEELQVACGIADYDRNVDEQYADVFRRADNLMYENKKMLKGLA